MAVAFLPVSCGFLHSALWTIPPDAPLVFLGSWVLVRIGFRQHRKRQAWALVRASVSEHAETLAQRRRDCLTPDHYGTVRTENWTREKTYFCKTHLQPTLAAAGLARFWPVLQKRAAKAVERTARGIVPIMPLPPPKKAAKKSASSPQERTAAPGSARVTARMDPLDYEKLCARILKKSGWKARLTAASSDQGADVIATRKNVRLVVQCKLYSRPVGNKAVQEVFAARQYQNAQIAAVVSNAGYTRQARQLAASTGVLLLHHTQLATLDEHAPPPVPV